MAEPIAIVGIGCRFPGADGPDAYWRLLTEGVDAIGEVPADRWPVEDFYDEQPRTPGRMNTRWGGFLRDIDSFDAGFFGISQREAERMDPQQRLALEVSYEALADAGIPVAGLAQRSVGVYVGASTYDHGAAMQSSGGVPGIYDGTGSALSVIANRISYCFDLRGPSLTVDTACSSSLVAIHAAAQAIRGGEAELAIAGGVNVITSPGVAIIFSQGGLMAPDGRCKTFDRRADGYVRGEGAGFVVLKPLARALADGDRVYATILGGATNHDGKTNGLTAPSRLAQQALLGAAYRDAGVAPAAVDYVEAHGTGTAVGDPIEVGALAAVLGVDRTADHALRVGSAKTNIGHLEAAAGVAGLIKTALSLHHRRLPGILHFSEPNPMLGLDRVPVVVQAELEVWPESEGAALAAVSSFGFGGTNAHVVMSAVPEVHAVAVPDARGVGLPEGPTVEVTVGRGVELPGAEASAGGVAEVLGSVSVEMPGAGGKDTPEAVGHVLIPLSVGSAEHLPETLSAWRDFAADLPDVGAVAAAVAVRGDHHRHRLAVVAADSGEIASALDAFARGETSPHLVWPRDRPGRVPRVAFVFPGQGPQWLGMGQRLAATVPEFAAALRRCDEVIAGVIGTSLWSDEAGMVADGTAHIQPALFAMQVALARTWMAWGVRPSAVVGHSMGEIAAAHISGALSLADAVRVVCARSELAEEISGRGSLALVEMGGEDALALTRGREAVLSVAALNGPRATVMSGTVAAIDELVAELEARKVFVRRIAVAFAAHSPEVEPLQPRLAEALRGLAPGPSEIPFYSTVEGEPVPGTALGADYWVRNLRAPVRFAPAADRLLADGHKVLIEISPHPVLGHALADIVAASDKDATVLTSMRRDEDEHAGLLRNVGAAYTLGVPVDWQARHPGPVPHRVLPRPVWARRRFRAIRAVDARDAVRGNGSLLGSRIPVAVDPSMRLWPLPWDLTVRPELAEHRVEDQAVVPGAYWLAAAQGAVGQDVAGPVVLRDVEFSAPYLPAESGGAALQLAIRENGAGERRFDILSLQANRAPVRHAHGIVGALSGAEPSVDLVAARARCDTELPVTTLYDELAAVGLRYGPAFRGLTEVWTGTDAALARFARPEGVGVDGAPLHPALLDACLHTVAAAAPRDAVGSLPLPVGVAEIVVPAGAIPLTAGWCHATLRSVGDRELVADVTVTDERGTPRWIATGFTVRYANPVRGPEQGRLYRTRWQPRDLPGSAVVTGPWLVIGDHTAVRRVAPLLAGAGVVAVIDADVDVAGRTGVEVTTEARPSTAADPDIAARTDPRVTTVVRRLSTAADHAEILADMTRDIGAPQGILDLRATVSGPKEPTADTVCTAAVRAAELLRAVAEQPGNPAVWFATVDTQRPGTGADASTLSGAALWGLVRSAAMELAETSCGLVDLTTSGDSGSWSVSDRDLDALTRVLCGATGSDQVIVRDGEVLEPNLARVSGVAAHRRPEFRPDRTYLITGGFGVIGVHVARWLIDRGARRLVLAGRNATSEAACAARTALAAPGVEIGAHGLDVSDGDQVTALIAEIQAGDRPLAGVFHAAGVLADALLPAASAAHFGAALGGKAMGAWHLHQATRDLPVEHFVLFSSLAGLTGSPGQAAYAGANTFLDALAELRCAAGLPGASVQFGTWAGAGLAVEAGGVDRLAGRGLPPLEPGTGIELLESALATEVATVAAAAFDPEPLGRTLAVLPPSVRTLLAPVAGTRADQADVVRGDLRAAVLALDSPTSRRAELERILVGLVAEVLGTDSAQIDPRLPFQEAGLDSLTAIELRDRLQAGFEMELSAALFFAHPTAEAFADELHTRLSGAPAEVPEVAPPPPPVRELPDEEPELSALDDDELAALLASEIDALRDLGER